MFKKIFTSILFCLLFVTNVMANDTSATININENTAKISLSGVPNNITAIQINITNNTNSEGTTFTPSKNFYYHKFIEKQNGNNTKLTIAIDDKAILTTNGNLEIGTLKFSNKPNLNTQIYIELFNIDENLKPTIKNINANLIIDGTNQDNTSSTTNTTETSTESTTQTTTKVTETTTKKPVESTTKTTTEDNVETSTESTTESTTKVTETTTKKIKENNTETTTITEFKSNSKKDFDINKEYPVIKEVKFNDIKNHWANDSIKFLAERGIINGASENEFLPNNNIKRAEFITLLAKLDNIDEKKYKINKFSDVEANAWYNPYIAWAVEKGIVNGISENIFAPNNNITREQMAVMLDRFATYKGFSLKPINKKIYFKDYSNISSYALNSVEKMQKAGIINGLENGNFAPKSNATKAQAAKMLHLLIINQ